MTKSNQPEPNDCRQIKDLLLEKPYDSLSAAERSFISIHLASCDSCRQYQQLLTTLEKTVAPSLPAALSPDPEIYKSLIKRWFILHPFPVRKTGKFFQSIKKVMVYRIPAYQVAIGFFLAVILAGVYHYFPKTDWRGEPPAASQPASDQTRPAFSDVYIRLDFTTAGKFGINMKEDSILTRFIHSSM
jgi:hypothetical protein